jgi:hypothetical protein
VRRFCRAVPAIAVAAATLAVVPVAGADFQSVYQDYQADGQIDECRHSAGSLDDARRQVPNDIEQYAPDFPAAVEVAQRNRGRCSGGGRGSGSGGGDRAGVSINAAGTPGGPGGPASADGVLVPRPPVPPRARLEAPATPTSGGQQAAASVDPLGSGSTPAPILFLAALTVLILAGLALATLGRFLGWGDGPLAPVRHGLSEAAMKVGAAAGGVLDRLRPGGPR